MPASAGACNRYLVNRLICYAYSLSSAPGIVHARFRDVVSVCGKRPFPRCQEQIKLLGVCEMTPYQRLIPFFDSYNRKVTDARNDLRLSLAELSEQSGVSYSAVATQSADTAQNPKLFEQAAICDTLGLSLDELCGLCPASDLAAVHELEMDNVRQAGDVKRLEEVNAMLKAQLASRRPVVYALLAVCALLLVCLISYMVWDAQLVTAGLFQSAGSSVLVVIFGLIVVAAVCVMVYALRMLRK